jgi:hypothetical protein
MNKLIYLGLMMLTAFPAAAQSKKVSNPSKPLVSGFRDLNWGVHIDSAWIGRQKLNFLKSNISREQNVYYLENDDLTVGTVNLTSIFYYFTDRGRFTKVLLVADKKFFTDMRYILGYKFEDPQEIREMNGNKVYQWNLDDVRIVLSDGAADGQMTVTFYIDYNLMESRAINRSINDF